MRGIALSFLALSSVMLSGCLAKTIIDVATLPVKVASAGIDAASAGVDLATTSQSEADQTRGREIRRREQRLARLEHDYGAQLDDCNKGDRNACNEARQTYAEMQQIIPTVPLEPED